MADPVSIGAAAAATLTAGIVGNLIGARIAQQAAREAEERRVARERQDELVRAGAAATQVRGELRVVGISLEWATDNGRWQRAGLPLPTAAWNAHGDLLLRHVEPSHTATVSYALAGVANMNEAMLAVLGEADSVDLGERLMNSVQEMHTNVLLADTALADVERRAAAAQERPAES